MKIHPIKRLSQEAGGEYVLGLKDLETHACYMIYGTLAPHEKQRLIKAGKGHEEIIVAVRGELKVSGPGLEPLKEIVLPEGSAFHITEESECYLENATETEAIYVAAGGHSTTGH